VNCGIQFVSKSRKRSTANHLLSHYVFHRQTASQLATQYGKSERWIRDTLALAKPLAPSVVPGKTVIIPDVTFFGRDYGILVCRDPHRKKNIYWQEVIRETIAEYQNARTVLEAQGVVITGVTIDGRRGVRQLFSDVPVQICQFHQVKTVTKYLTRKPKLLAGQELRQLTLQLKYMNEVLFTALLHDWYLKWEDFLKERTYADDGTHWTYTHRRTRAAYHSLKTNLPYLFTYQKYPELKLPNTTNSADGYFNTLKDLLRTHRGMSKQKRYLLISKILAR
jgi:hypothetical protein